ncbi:MAG: tRNA (N6-isopentenyl adenosine(37)-C2)-methylthiotransferase MiaB [Clostridia bacterium]|nr:tRNA (N6-isopentenyl adenosine(37)-C2)-methylthiotransferase MiaB [Clostridia bacterium]MBQ8513148.1 tRNA (N6-isopentenyl adenosine(37)-C2)-methylthiotransferase MiaB [Clostridia bacterium]
MTDNYIESKIIDDATAAQLAKATAVASIHAKNGETPGYFVQTFGCQQNEADSERLAGLCTMMGYKPVSSPAEAKLILVNTCAVREHAEKKALSIIGQYKHIKDADPTVIIGVGGCMVTQQSRADKLKMSYPYVAFTFDTGAIHTVPSLVYEALTGGKRRFVLSDAWKINEGLPITRSSRHQAWLSIMYGCNNFCSYCIVPYVRGRERSRKAEDILEEARQLIAGGAKDITLLGQNVNSYKGGDGCDIAELMHKICALDGDFRLRFMTSHPKDASDRLIEAMASEEKIVKHFHLPVQSGSDRILHEMNRKYTAEAYLEKIAKLKAAVPDVSITSDIIVGFPGETEDDFEATLEMMRAVQYDMVFSFIYSPRTGTPAAVMENQIPREVSAARMERLLALGDGISKERNERFVGRTLRILVEDVSKYDADMLTGRGSPVRPVHFKGEKSLIGKFVNVKITGNETFCLNGEIVR